MKKIVGIIAAVAMAASVFAVDFTAGVRMEGNIFSYNADAKSYSALSVTNSNENYHKPFVFSISDDRAGATVKFNESKGDVAKITHMNIWFKPFDAVKVELGNVSEAMNTETMGWYRRILNYDTWGFKATVEVDALKISAALLTDKGADWYTKDGDIKEVNVYAAYNAADAGTFSAMLDYKGKYTTPGVAAGTDTSTPVWDTATNKYVPKTIDPVAAVDHKATTKIAAGYKNSFGDVAVFADYMYVLADANANVIDADVKYSADGLTAEVYNKVTLAKGSDAADQLVARVSKGFDGLNTYVEFDSGNILADKFDAKITISVSGNVGVMAWEVAPNYGIAAKTFAVPFNVAVAF